MGHDTRPAKSRRGGEGRRPLPDLGLESLGVLAAAVTLIIIWMPAYPAGIDLPGHATQIHIWKHFDEGFADTHRINWFTPYLFGYVITRGFAELAGVAAGLKILVSLAALAQYAALRLLLRQVGGERWLALFAFPFFLGVAFYWGFLNFLVAVPIGLFYVLFSFRFSETPSASRALALCLVGVLLFFAHGVAYVVCAVAGALVVLPDRIDWKQIAIRSLPAAGSGLLALAWVVTTLEAEPRSSRLAWRGTWERVLGIPASWVSWRADFDSACLAIALLLFVVIGSGLLLRWRARAALPFATALAFHLLMPSVFFGIAMIQQRLGIFVSCFALLLATPSGTPRQRRWLRARSAVAVGVLLSIQTARSAGFAGEIRGFDDVVEQIPAGENVCMSPEHKASAFYSPLAFGNFDSWVVLHKPVRVDFSWASFYTSMIRFQPGTELRFGFEECEYLLARSDAGDFGSLQRQHNFARLQERVHGSLALVARSDSWYLLRRNRSPEEMR